MNQCPLAARILDAVRKASWNYPEPEFGWNECGDSEGPLGTPGEPHVPPQNADTAKQLTVTQQSQEEVARVKEQLAFQVEQVKREAEMKVSLWILSCFPDSTEPSPAWEMQFGSKERGWLLLLGLDSMEELPWLLLGGRC